MGILYHKSAVPNVNSFHPEIKCVKIILTNHPNTFPTYLPYQPANSFAGKKEPPMPHRTDRKFETEGPALRALHSFLKEADKSEHWGGLRKTPTNDGNIFWLCAEHQPLYKPL
jgi:hypothetical protein